MGDRKSRSGQPFVCDSGCNVCVQRLIWSDIILKLCPVCGLRHHSVAGTHTHTPVQTVHKCSTTCSHHNMRHHAGLKSHSRPTPSVFHTCISNKPSAPTGTPQSHIPCCKPPFHHSNVFIFTSLLSADANKLMLLGHPNLTFCSPFFLYFLYTLPLSPSL